MCDPCEGMETHVYLAAQAQTSYPLAVGACDWAVGCPSHGASLWAQLFKRKPKVLSSSFHRNVYEENGTLSGGFSKKNCFSYKYISLLRLYKSWNLLYLLVMGGLP